MKTMQWRNGIWLIGEEAGKLKKLSGLYYLIVSVGEAITISAEKQ